MQISEFIEATARLEAYYGKDYTTEQRQIMFEELKYLPIDRYKRLTSAVIRKSKFLPKVADIIEANTEEPYTTNNQEKERKECKRCKGLGYITYTKIIKNGNKQYKNIYGAVCDCGNASKYEGWNITDKEHKTDFYTPLIQE